MEDTPATLYDIEVGFGKSVAPWQEISPTSASPENDYEYQTTSFNISMDLFGELATVTLVYTVGSDIVRSVADARFEDAIFAVSMII